MVFSVSCCLKNLGLCTSNCDNFSIISYFYCVNSYKGLLYCPDSLLSFWLVGFCLFVCFKVHISREEEDSSSLLFHKVSFCTICTECFCLPCPLYSVGAINVGRACQVLHAGWHFLLFWTEKLRRSGSRSSIKQPTTLLKKKP